MIQSSRRAAFTLIELLTVMAIITLLIGILTPALSGARDTSRKTAVLAQINAMAAGLEAFRGDQAEYPPSNAILYANDPGDTDPAPPDADTQLAWWEVGTTAAPYQGAHILVDALVGRDFLGYDPKAPKSATDTYDRWDPANGRRQPYIPKDGIDVTSENEPPEDGFGVVPDTLGDPTPENFDNLLARVFRDKFGWPILYYRASPVANQTTEIMQTTTNTHPLWSDGVYDGVDNEVFTSYYTSSDPLYHKIWQANVDLAVQVNYGDSLQNENNFAEFIHSFRSSTYDTTNPTEITFPRPVRADTFILLSAGKDGIYGTLDDVANFNVLSEER